MEFPIFKLLRRELEEFYNTYIYIYFFWSKYCCEVISKWKHLHISIGAKMHIFSHSNISESKCAFQLIAC